MIMARMQTYEWPGALRKTRQSGFILLAPHSAFLTLKTALGRAGAHQI
jgi:hypothetical protein